MNIRIGKISGFSLLEDMLALGIIGGIAVTVMNIDQIITRNKKDISSLSSSLNLKNEVEKYLQNRDACERSFAGGGFDALPVEPPDSTYNLWPSRRRINDNNKLSTPIMATDIQSVDVIYSSTGKEFLSVYSDSNLNGVVDGSDKGVYGDVSSGNLAIKSIQVSDFSDSGDASIGEAKLTISYSKVDKGKSLDAVKNLEFSFSYINRKGMLSECFTDVVVYQKEVCESLLGVWNNTNKTCKSLIIEKDPSKQYAMTTEGDLKVNKSFSSFGDSVFSGDKSKFYGDVTVLEGFLNSVGPITLGDFSQIAQLNHLFKGVTHFHNNFSLISGELLLEGGMNVKKNFTLYGNSEFFGNTNFSNPNGLTKVFNSTTFLKTLEGKKDLTGNIGGTLTIKDTIMADNLTVSGQVTASGDITVNENVQVNGVAYVGINEVATKKWLANILAANLSDDDKQLLLNQVVQNQSFSGVNSFVEGLLKDQISDVQISDSSHWSKVCAPSTNPISGITINTTNRDFSITCKNDQIYPTQPGDTVLIFNGWTDTYLKTRCHDSDNNWGFSPDNCGGNEVISWSGGVGPLKHDVTGGSDGNGACIFLGYDDDGADGRYHDWRCARKVNLKY